MSRKGTHPVAKHAHDPVRAQPPRNALKLERVQAALIAWYLGARRAMPWRETRDPYAIWLSEVMLQQTRVETVIPYYLRFLRAYPTVHALAEAPLDDVLTMWSGLGYYRRARMLHAGAQHVSRELAGRFPRSAEGLRAIAGIGPYTAGAVASIAFGLPAALVDGNVARVLSRVYAIEEDVRAGAGLARVWATAEAIVFADDPGAWNQALMELGSTVCLPREPRCDVCPVRKACMAKARGIERELPRLKAKPKPTLHRRASIVATYRGDVLLGQRHAAGRFGGMWEPPMIDDHEDMAKNAEALAALVGVALGDIAPAGHVTHILSHRKMEIAVIVARLLRAPGDAPRERGEYAKLARVSKDAVGARALTKLARKVLAVAGIAFTV